MMLSKKMSSPQIKNVIVEITSYFFVLLFTYAAVSKLITFQEFQTQLTQSPLLAYFAPIIAWFIPIVEILISILLLSFRLRLAALYACFVLMLLFTTYITIILTLSDRVPCSCGGVLEEMGWMEHLIFNIGVIGLALLAILLFNPKAGPHPAVSHKKESNEIKI